MRVFFATCIPYQERESERERERGWEGGLVYSRGEHKILAEDGTFFLCVCGCKNTHVYVYQEG